jgi:hypothetical protein
VWANEHVSRSMFATGYLYHYPFADTAYEPFKSFPLTRPLFSESREKTLADPAAEEVPGTRVHNLDDRLLFYVPDPTLVILTAPYLVSLLHTLSAGTGGADFTTRR